MVCSTVPVRLNTNRWEVAKRRFNASAAVSITAAAEAPKARADRRAASSARNASVVASRPNRSSSTAASAFEEFKKTAGMDKHALLLENKRALRESKASVRTLGAQVNAAKRQIDETKARLDRLRGPRAAASPARGAAEVIGEEEFQLLEALREAKQRYRDAFSRMSDERDKYDYVAQTVENCRAQLLTDFGSFLKAERPDAAASADALLAAVSAGMRE